MGQQPGLANREITEFPRQQPFDDAEKAENYNMTEKLNQDENQKPDPAVPPAAENTLDGLNLEALNSLDLNTLMQQQGLKTADIEAMMRQMMGSYPLTVTADGQVDGMVEAEDDDAEYDEDEDEAGEAQKGGVASQQNVYQLAESLLSSPLMSQFSALMGGPKMNEAERRFNQGKAFQAGGMLDEAAEAYLDVIDLDHDHFRAHVAMGQVLLTMDRPTDAIPFLQQATELDPQDPGAPLYLGYAYYGLEQYEQCVAAFEQAVELEPYNHLALNNLGFSQFLTDRLAAAEQTFVRAGDQGSDRAYYNLGMVRLLQDKPDAAWEAYTEAAELDPNGAQIEDHLGDLQKAYQQYPDHAVLLDQAVEKLQARLADEEYADNGEYEDDYDDEADD